MDNSKPHGKCFNLCSHALALGDIQRNWGIVSDIPQFYKIFDRFKLIIQSCSQIIKKNTDLDLSWWLCKLWEHNYFVPELPSSPLGINLSQWVHDTVKTKQKKTMELLCKSIEQCSNYFTGLVNSNSTSNFVIVSPISNVSHWCKHNKMPS